MRSKLMHALATIAASLAFTTSAPAPAVSADKLIDLSIEAVDPELAKYRPVLKCAVGGTPIETCAENATIGQLGKIPGSVLDELTFAEHVYHMAKSGDVTGLVAALGVNATCTVMRQVAAGSAICNAFAAQLVTAATELGKAGKAIAMTVGAAVVEGLTQLGTGVTCATKVYCPDDDKDDPNKFNYHYAGGKLAIDKFDLEAIWQQDYAPRLPEGVIARLSDPAQLGRMVAVPPVRAITFQQAGGKSLFLDPAALGAASINARVKDMLAVDQASKQSGHGGIPVGLLDVQAQAFIPFERELNARWLAEVNKTAAARLEGEAQQFLSASKAWSAQKLPALTLANFNPGSIQPQGWHSAALADCRAQIENPARALLRWANGAPRFKDNTLVAGKSAAFWQQASRNFCARRIDAELAGRMQNYQAAVSHGCKPRGDGQKGLECPAQSTAKQGYTPYKVKGDEVVGGQAKGVVSVNPGELCRAAFAPQGAQLCLVPPGAPALLRPLRPSLAPPPPAPSPTPSPAPSPAPTFRPVVRPKVLTPGG